jgi:hypothetical protein
MRSFILVLSLSLVACGPYVIRGADPHPTTLVPSGTYALQLAPSVLDLQEFENIRIEGVQDALARGFHNAMGTHAVSEGQGAKVLVIDEFSLYRENVGMIGVLQARVRGRWLAPDGTELSQFAGRGTPRNGMARGVLQLNDLIERMYEEVIGDFIREQTQAPATAGGQEASRSSGIR